MIGREEEGATSAVSVSARMLRSRSGEKKFSGTSKKRLTRGRKKRINGFRAE
jgi:hypothetical protein